MVLGFGFRFFVVGSLREASKAKQASVLRCDLFDRKMIENFMACPLSVSKKCHILPFFERVTLYHARKMLTYGSVYSIS